MFVLFIFLAGIICSNGINEECFLKGLRGVCQPLNVCYQALDLLSNDGVNFCEFDETEDLICCPDEFRKPTRRPPSPKPQDLNRRHKRPQNQELPLFRVPEQDPAEPSYTTKKPNRFSILPSNDIPLSVKKCKVYYRRRDVGIFVKGETKPLPKQYPHIARIGFGPEESKEWLCSGSLISDNFVLTAAHCLESREYGEAKWVRLGDLDISSDKDEADPQDFKILKRIPHPNYLDSIKYNDIALIQIEKYIHRSSFVYPACLQSKRLSHEPSMIASGWGKTKYSEESSNFLLQVYLKEIGTKECNNFYSDAKSSFLPNGINGDMMICAGGEVEQDTCQGNSGGGQLQVRNRYKNVSDTGFTIVGISSFGKACGDTRSPAVYTRVSYYLDWIESIVWPQEYKKAHPTFRPRPK
ncbi:phenoloxidase-activating factor 3-like [Diabrotica virgifera virgifera]|uniref:Peptidase S1 domain-containing protein n=1 Tax=Diabrotica virgifera virgifera TaxID=50390 RepID=A0ABM5IL43_DIAVI|nr:phenoloxidase-activating factor 3-like [Diabrotica virgifera virgifera]